MSFSYISQQLENQRDSYLIRQRQLVEEQAGRELVVNGKRYLNFSSNDYLGLNNHPKINQAMQEGVDRFGASSCSSSLVTGYNFAHQALEETICAWLNKPKCLLFNSGFSANYGVLNTLANDQTQFWLDKLSHASLIDGALSGKAKVQRFLHNDYAQLDKKLASKQLTNNLVVSEGVFSMDGDQANIVKLHNIAKKHQAWLYVDDAHSIGIIGKEGQGSSLYDAKIDIVMATFGKAIATSGAFIACDNELHDYLVNFSRHYIYSTAISPAISWATKTSIEIIQKEHWRREKIIQLSHLFSSTLNKNISLIPTTSSIHAIILGSEQKALEIAQQLKRKGIWLTAIRPPTVAKNTSRLRVTICASHNKSDIIHLAECLNKVVN